MAEYAGLEIRIGGDTTSLNAALKASTKSAAELQSRIRQATRAMQFDPTDLKNVETRIRITGNRMQSLQSKVQLARKAMEQLGDSMVVFGGRQSSVRDVAAATSNLSLEAKQADERFVRLRDSLATVYETWNKAARQKGVDFLRDQLGIDAKTASSLMSTETSLSSMVAEIREINNARRAGLMNGPIIEPDQIEALKQLKTLNFHGMFEEGADLDTLVQQARELGIVINDDVVEAVENMRSEFVGAQQDKKALDKALQFDQIGVDIQRWDSEVVGMSNDIRRLDDSMTSVGSSEKFQGLEAQLREVDAALDNVMDDLKRTESALELDPGNIELAVRHFNDLRQQAELSEERVSILKQEMAELNAAGAGEALKGHQDLAQWVEQAAEGARKARIEFSDQQAVVSNLRDGIERLQQHIAMLGSDSSAASMTENVQNWLTKTQQLETATAKVAQRTQELGEAQARYDNAQRNLDEATAAAERYEAQLESLRQKQDRLWAQANAAQDAGDFSSWEGALDRLAKLDEEIAEVSASAVSARHEVDNITSDLSIDSNALESAKNVLSAAQSEAEGLRLTVDKLSQTRDVRAFADFPATIEESKAALQSMQGELGDAIVKEKQLGSAYTAAQSENELAKSANKLQDLSAELEDTRNQAKAAAEAMKGLTLGDMINPSTIKSIGMTLSATVTPLFSGIGYKMMDASSTVDAAYRDMRKTVNATEEQFERLKQSAIDFSRTHVTSADQILQIEAIGGELGVATESLETFAEVISNIDVATNLDTESAAEALGHLSNVLHLSEDDFVGFSDAFVRLGNNGASTESEIANIAERIGSMASIVGMSAPDVLAWASSIASTGQNAEAAGTAISKTMSFFETAVASAGGTIDTSFDAINAAVQNGGSELVMFSNLMGHTAEDFANAWEMDPEAVFGEVNNAVIEARDSLQGIADVAHMSAQEFAAAWESDPTAVMKAFIEGLNEIEAAGGSADAVLQGFKITSVRQKQAIEGLMQTIGGLDDNLAMSRNAWNGVTDQWGKAGDAANEAAKKAEGFSGQVQILKNMAQIALSELGEGAVPYIKVLASGLEKLSSGFSGLSSSTKSFIVALGGIATAIGPFLSIAGTFLTAKAEMVAWADKALTAMAVVRSAFASGGEEAVKALTGTRTTMDKFMLIAKDFGASLLGGLQFAAVVAAIAAIGFGIKKLYDDWKTHIKATEGLSNALAGIGKSASDAGKDVETGLTSLQRLMKESSGYEERLASLADTINESNSQYGTYSARLEYYSDVVRDLGGRSNLTQDEMRKLAAALSAINDECGTTYGLDEYGNIIDTNTGQVQANTDAINANVEARRAQALMEYYADDYAQATEQWAEAQARVNELEEERTNLLSDEGHQAYVEEQMAKNRGNRAQAEEVYNAAVKQTEEALANEREELARTETAMSDLEAQMDMARVRQDEANRTLEEAAQAQEAYNRRSATVTNDVTGNMNRLSKTITDMGKTDIDFNNIVSGLDAVHVYANELDGVDMSGLAAAFDTAGGSMQQVIDTLESGGVNMATWNAALEQAPGAAEKMGSVTSAAFQSMYEMAGNDLTNTMTLIEGLDTVMGNVDGQQVTFYIGDNGSIFDAQGKVYNIQSDLKNIPDEVITAYYVDDEDALAAAMETKAQLQEVDAETVSPTITATDEASGKIAPVQKGLNTVGSSRPNPAIRASDYASGTISSVSSNLRSLNGRSATVTIYENTVRKTTQATGGMNSVPVVPRHASGYIATGPTMTNQGWIGEDGIEAVANWATGGAVVPLTNKKYMLPIADAIADGMALRMGGVTGQTVNYIINGITVAPDSALAKAMDATFDEARRFTRMGRK